MHSKYDIKQIIVWIAVFLLVLISFSRFSFFHISTERAILYPLSIPEKFISSPNFIDPIKSIVYDLITFLSPFIPIVLALSLLSIYGAKFGENRKLGFTSTTISSLLGLAFVGVSYTSVLLVLGISVSGLLSTGLSEMYFKEMKKWKKYRVGANVVKKCFFIINLMLLFGVIITIATNQVHYENEFKNATKEIVEGLIPKISYEDVALTNINLPPEQRSLLEEQYKNEINKEQELIDSKIDEMFNSTEFKGLVYFSLFSISLAIYGVLEFLNTVLFSPLSGLITQFSLKKV
ncbi:MAG: hypothetical protein J7L45_01575 [Candidatus Aenigmarchaeota archaeon]|nr:hypothetical protein [Candidatus Aenigmarchaeota archaeon]